MKHLLLTIVTLVGITGSAYASDPMGVYGRIDKVVLEPNSESPETAQVWGTFALAIGAPGTGGKYTTPRYGYFYYQLVSGKEETVRREWRDFAKASETKDCVSYGHRYHSNGHFRLVTEKVESPDPHPVAMGVVFPNEQVGECSRIPR